MNDSEREMWILNDEGLFRWWKRSRMGMRRFIRANRDALTRAIKRAMGEEPDA